MIKLFTSHKLLLKLSTYGFLTIRYHGIIS